jgi:hypothetical protein
MHLHDESARFNPARGLGRPRTGCRGHGDGTGHSFCRERLARFKLPRRVQGVTSLPVTSVGKVDKVQMRSLATGDASPSEPSR